MEPYHPPQLELPPPDITQRRLESALYLTHILRPEAYEVWSRSPSFYAFSRCREDFSREEKPYRRTAREDLALTASGLIVTTYWMDVFPRRSVPTRQDVEQLFQNARFGEETVVGPLSAACVVDPNNGLTNEQRVRIKDTTTLEELETAITELDPAPPDIETSPLRARQFPISRATIASVLRPLIARLGEQLEAEGHTPYNWHYLQQQLAQKQY